MKCSLGIFRIRRETKNGKYEINDEMTRPYFELNKVIGGVFGLATDLYGITFKENRDIPVYHKEVIPYEVFDETASLFRYCTPIFTHATANEVVLG